MTFAQLSPTLVGCTGRRAERRDDAFESLVATRRRALVGFAYGLTGNMTDAEELAAEAIARCWTALRNRQIDQLELYVRRAMVNLTIQRMRSRRIEERYKPCKRDDWRIGTAVDDQYDLSSLEHDDLVAALRELPPDHRAAVVTRYLFDHSEEETALILSIPVGTVKSRCSRAIASLRTRLSAISLQDG